MTADSASDLQILIERLHRIHNLSNDDRTALECLPLHTAVVYPGDSIVRVGEQADRCAIILEGMAASYKVTRNGKRQIVCLHLAGDLPDLQGLCFDTAETGITAMSDCRVGYVSSSNLLKVCSQHPSLAAVLWRETLLQGAIVREWLLSVGRRDARARLAHIFCEMISRHRDAGFTSDYSCPFPLTQISLADAVGLSVVHLNRMIQDLRNKELITLKERRLTVLDWAGLCAAGDFDFSYLRLNSRRL